VDHMEFEYQDVRRRRNIMVGLGVILALATGVAAFYLLSQARQQAGQATLARVPVVVATRQIPPRKPIEPDDVVVREVPIDATNQEGVYSDPSLLVGRVLAVPALAGQLVTANLLASATTGETFSILGPDETVGPDSEVWRAVSITVPDDRAVGGLLTPTMTVDVLVTATVNVPQSLLNAGRYYTDKTTKLAYQDMLILAKTGQSYVLKAPLALAEEIAHLQSSGTIQFSLLMRPQVDTRLVDATPLGATTNMLIRRYGLPVPEVYPQGRGPIPAGGDGTSVSPRPSPSPSPAPEESPTPSPTP
jgi:Flp pilus assembly protein CpaB